MKANEKMRSITPEKAQQILMENGLKLSVEKATLALDLLYTLAIVEINEKKKNENKNC